MQNKTYEERLAGMAEKLANGLHPIFKHYTTKGQECIIKDMLPLARIALSFGAECYEAGHLQAMCNPMNDVDLTSLGLKPQN